MSFPGTGNTGWLTLDVITKDLAVTLSTTLSETLMGEKISCKFRTRPNELWCLYLATFATARHCVVLKCLKSWCEVRFDCARNGGGLCVLLKAECKWGLDNDQVSSYIPRLSVYVTR